MFLNKFQQPKKHIKKYNLPKEIVEHILSFLDKKTLVNIKQFEFANKIQLKNKTSHYISFSLAYKIGFNDYGWYLENQYINGSMRFLNLKYLKNCLWFLLNENTYRCIFNNKISIYFGPSNCGNTIYMYQDIVVNRENFDIQFDIYINLLLSIN